MSVGLEIQALPADHRLFELAADEDCAGSICYFRSILLSAAYDGSWDPDVAALNEEAMRVVANTPDICHRSLMLDSRFDELFALLSPERRRDEPGAYWWDCGGPASEVIFGSESLTPEEHYPTRYLPASRVPAAAAFVAAVDTSSWNDIFTELREGHYSGDLNIYRFVGSRDFLETARQDLVQLQTFYRQVEARGEAVMFSIG